MNAKNLTTHTNNERLDRTVDVLLAGSIGWFLEQNLEQVGATGYRHVFLLRRVNKIGNLRVSRLGLTTDKTGTCKIQTYRHGIGILAASLSAIIAKQNAKGANEEVAQIFRRVHRHLSKNAVLDHLLLENLTHDESSKSLLIHTDSCLMYCKNSRTRSPS